MYPSSNIVRPLSTIDTSRTAQDRRSSRVLRSCAAKATDCRSLRSPSSAISSTVHSGVRSTRAYFLRRRFLTDFLRSTGFKCTLGPRRVLHSLQHGISQQPSLAAPPALLRGGQWSSVSEGSPQYQHCLLLLDGRWNFQCAARRSYSRFDTTGPPFCELVVRDETQNRLRRGVQGSGDFEKTCPIVRGDRSTRPGNLTLGLQEPSFGGGHQSRARGHWPASRLAHRSLQNLCRRKVVQRGGSGQKAASRADFGQRPHQRQSPRGSIASVPSGAAQVM